MHDLPFQGREGYSGLKLRWKFHKKLFMLSFVEYNTRTGISRLRDSRKSLFIPVSRFLVIPRYGASW